MVEGAIVTGNVLTGGTADVFGADGAAQRCRRAAWPGLRRAATPLLPVSGGVGTPIDGSFGVLTLNADGSYSYDGNPNVVPPAGATDTFVYTIKDGDGDTSTTTLTINADEQPDIAANDRRRDGEREGAALPDGLTLPSSTVTGSLPGSAADTDATNQLTAAARPAHLCAGERPQRGDRAGIRHDPCQCRMAATSTR